MELQHLKLRYDLFENNSCGVACFGHKYRLHGIFEVLHFVLINLLCSLQVNKAYTILNRADNYKHFGLY